MLSLAGVKVTEVAASRLAGGWRSRSRILVVACSLIAFSVWSYRQELDQEHREELLRELVQLPDGLKTTLTHAQSSLCGSLSLLESVQEPLPRLWPPTLPQPDPEPESPLYPGFGALSDPKNPTRDRLLVAIFACDEQETGAQMHMRQVLHLGKALGRTVVAPNFGGQGIPTLSNCQPYAYDDIFRLEEANAAGLWSVAYPTYEKWVEKSTKGAWWSLSAQVVVMSSDYAWEQVKNLPQNDRELLERGCVKVHPYAIDSPRLYMSTANQQKMSDVVKGLAGTDDMDVVFMYFNHKSVFVAPEISDPLLQERPEWGLWARNPFPYWNYTSFVQDTYDTAVAKLPANFIAMQWRMERVPPPALDKCSGLFLDGLLEGARSRGIDTVYIAADAPLRPDEPFKSASWDTVFTVGVRAAVAKLIDGLEAANIKVVTWSEIRPTIGENEAQAKLALDSPGIFDRLVVGKAASWVFAPNTNCGMKSAYLGSIQTMRQDRIGDPTETDWNKLGMTWVGAPLAGTFWWGIMPEWENWDKVGLAAPAP